jgi:uncharacterized protein (TIGR03437 family)
MTVYGANLANVAGNLDGWSGAIAPTSLNGVSVSIDGKAAPVLQVRPGTVIAQVPFEATTGMVDLSVTTAGGASNTLKVNVGRVAPAIFFDQVNPAGNRAVAYDMATGTQMTQDNPAVQGMTLAVFGTGFGQSSPAQTTGEVANFRVLARFPEVRVTVGPLSSASVATVLIPGLVGLTQTIFTVPAGSGALPIEVEYQGVKSNRTMLYMR